MWVIVSAFVLFQSYTMARFAASPQTGTPGTDGGAALVVEMDVVVGAEVEFKARTCWAPATLATQANGRIWRRAATILQALGYN